VLNGTARLVWTVHTEFVSKQQDLGSLLNLETGDVLVQHPTALREHEINIVPDLPYTSSATHDAAVTDGHAEAAAMGVDAWPTEHQSHVVKMASNPMPGKELGSEPSSVPNRVETHKERDDRNR